MEYALKRLNWYQQDLFDAEGDVNDFINMVEMKDEDINKLSDEFKDKREFIIKCLAESDNIPNTINNYKADVQDILRSIDYDE